MGKSLLILTPIAALASHVITDALLDKNQGENYYSRTKSPFSKYYSILKRYMQGTFVGL